jgi:hypothetical protein
VVSAPCLRVFRDTTSLSASPELWPSIERALEALAALHPAGLAGLRASPWVDQEVAVWRGHRESATA